MPSLQLQLVISPSVVHVRDLKLFLLKAPKASLVFSYSALPLIFVVFLFFFLIWDSWEKRVPFWEKFQRREIFFNIQHNPQQSGSPNSWSILQKIMPFESWPLHANSTKQKKMSTPAWYFHRDSQQYCTYLHSFLEGYALLSMITSKLLTLSHFFSLFLWRAWLVQWWELSPRINMGGVQILVCGLSLLLIFSFALRGFFFGYTGVLPKNQHCQMPIWSECTDTFKGVFKNF